MEKIYKPKDFFASEPVIIDKIRNDLSELAEPFSDRNQCDADTLNFFGLPIDTNELSILIQRTSITKLSIPGELELLVSHGPDHMVHRRLSTKSVVIPEEAKHFKSIQLLEYRQKNSRTLHENTDSYLKNLKYRSEIRITHEPKIEETTDLEPGKECIISIQVYVPFRYIVGAKNNCVPKFSYELDVLGSSTLAEFKNKFLCPSNMGISSDISNKISENFDEVGRKQYSSSVICIGDTLYHDDSDPNNIDYTTVILEWAHKRRTVVGPFKKAKMSETLFKDLKIRLGYPYVYQHLGDCEHLFTISDIRMLHHTDSLLSTNYPRFTAASCRAAKYCMICGSIISKFVVTQCDQLISDPSYLCNDCFRSYLYIDGKKICSFKAYLYYDSSCLL